MFRAAVQAVLQDDGFKFPSPSATEALHVAASQMLPWCSDTANTDTMTAFVSQLFEMYDRCMCGTGKLSHSKRIERIWGTFHTERCSPFYKSSWSAFLHPAFQRQPYLLPIQCLRFTNTRLASSLSYEEKNCLRYVAGALFRAVQKKVERSALTMKEEMLALYGWTAGGRRWSVWWLLISWQGRTEPCVKTQHFGCCLRHQSKSS